MTSDLRYVKALGTLQAAVEMIAGEGPWNFPNSDPKEHVQKLAQNYLDKVEKILKGEDDE